MTYDFNGQVDMKMTLGSKQQPNSNRIRPIKPEHGAGNHRAGQLTRHSDRNKHQKPQPIHQIPRLKHPKIRRIPHPQEENRKENRGKQVINPRDNPLRQSPFSRQANPGDKSTQKRTIIIQRRRNTNQNHKRHRQHKMRPLHRFPFRILGIHPPHENRRNRGGEKDLTQKC